MIDPDIASEEGQARMHALIERAGKGDVVRNIDVLLTAWLSSDANDGTDESLAMLAYMLVAITGDPDAVAYFNSDGDLCVTANLSVGTVH